MIFIDSNIWLYGLLVPADPVKRQQAIELCGLPDICISSQVVNEVLANYRKKQQSDEQSLRIIVDEFYSDYFVLDVLQEDILEASELREEYHFSYWDSLIVATALRARAETLYSEDMQNGLVVRHRLSIRNPFV